MAGRSEEVGAVGLEGCVSVGVRRWRELGTGTVRKKKYLSNMFLVGNGKLSSKNIVHFRKNLEISHSTASKFSNLVA